MRQGVCSIHARIMSEEPFFVGMGAPKTFKISIFSNILWKLQNRELSARGSKELVSSDSGIDIHPPISFLHMANTNLKCFANSNFKIITNTNFRYLANSLEYKKRTDSRAAHHS